MQPYGPPSPATRRPTWLLPTGIGCGGLLAVLGLLVVAGLIIGPPPEDAAAPVRTPAPARTLSSPAARPARPSPPPSSAPAPARRQVPRPTAAQAEAYLAAIARIDPGLVADRERALRRARGVCDRIINPRGGNVTLEYYTAYMLSGGDAVIDEGQARRVIAAVRVWCR